VQILNCDMWIDFHTNLSLHCSFFPSSGFTSETYSWVWAKFWNPCLSVHPHIRNNLMISLLILRGPRGVLLSASFLILTLSCAWVRHLRHHQLRVAAIRLRKRGKFVMSSYQHLIKARILEHLLISAMSHPLLRHWMGLLTLGSWVLFRIKGPTVEWNHFDQACEPGIDW